MKVANFFAASKIEYMEVPTSEFKNEFDFPRLQILDGQKITCIETYLSTDVNIAPSGKILVNMPIMKKAYLILDIKGKNLVNKYPLVGLVKALNGGISMNFDFLEIDWQKSKIFIPELSSLALNETFLFTVHYDESLREKTC